MTVRPYHAYALLALAVVLPPWRLARRPRQEFVVDRARVGRWGSLTRLAPEEIERGIAGRYRDLAPALRGIRDVGYFSEKDRSGLWAESSTPGGHDRIERYYMAQSMLAPALLRFDELRPLIVIDCAAPEQAAGVVRREGLEVVRDFGRGLILARPGA